MRKILFFIILFLPTKIMSDDFNPRSVNYFISDANALNIIKIKNLKKSSLPDMIFETINPKKDAEVEFNIKVPFYFDEMILSPSPLIYDGDIIKSDVIIDDDEFSFGNFSIGKSNSIIKKDSLGEMDVDTLRLNKKIKEFTVKIKIFNKSGKKTGIKLINIVITNRDKNFSNPILPGMSDTVILSVPKISQLEQQVNYAGDICSPTSLSMLLNYYGIDVSTVSCASDVIDTSKNIYGNWIFNTSYASTKNLYSFIVRINSYDELKRYLQKGIPVIASITFGPDELKNSPIKKTTGHLLVIKGIDKNGNIITNDPAALNSSRVEVVYDKKEFANAWFKNKYGTSYILVDDIFKLISSAVPYSEIKKDDDVLTQITPDEEIRLVERTADSILVEAVEQKIEGKDGKPEGYKGYIDRYGFSLPKSYNAFVSEKLAKIYDDKRIEIDKTISAGTRIDILDDYDNFFLAMVDNMMFFISKKDVITDSDLHDIKDTGKAVIEKARDFIGTVYYWGGRTSDKLDCSGLTSLIHKIYGYTIPRDANDQFIYSKKIKTFNELKLGDLIFSTKENSDFVDHVMLYSGDGNIIEATKECNCVREIPFLQKFEIDLKNVIYGKKINGKKIYFGRFIDDNTLKDDKKSDKKNLNKNTKTKIKKSIPNKTYKKTSKKNRSKK
ncbi:MAG: hypothetical protein GX445_04220 [Elusimicrobia bacterium]|nr:hypothetical protein [Elusimicrobiota bacterium]